MFSKIVKTLPTLYACAIVSFSTGAYAAGFYIQEQSVSGMGAAYAGAAALARDASIVFYNPAGMTGLEGRQVYGAANLLVPRASLKDRGSDAPAGLPNGGRSDNPVGAVVVPTAYAAWPVNDRLWLGLGISSPFGLTTEYKEDWLGRFDSIRSELRTIDIQPSAAYRINDWLSVGGGLNMQKASAVLTSAVFDGAEGVSRLQGHDISFGWNAGILLTPYETTRIGLHYRSEMRHRLEGSAVVTDTAASDINLAAHANLDLPDIATFGIAQDIGNKWTLLGQVSWFGWNDFETIKAVLSTGTVAENVVQNYQATKNIALGAEYKWSGDTTLRAGYQFDQTPSTGEYRSTRIPDSSRHWFTAGASRTLGNGLSLDLGAAYLAMKDAHIDIRRNSNLAQVKLEKTGASIGIVSLGLSYKF